MKKAPEILNELMAISPLLAGLEKVNVFSVPEGYFDDLQFRITNYAILNNTSPVKTPLKEVFSRFRKDISTL